MKKLIFIIILILFIGGLNSYSLNIHREKSSTYAEETTNNMNKKQSDEEDRDFKSFPISPIMLNTNAGSGDIPLFFPGAAFSLPKK